MLFLQGGAVSRRSGLTFAAGSALYLDGGVRRLLPQGVFIMGYYPHMPDHLKMFSRIMFGTHYVRKGDGSGFDDAPYAQCDGYHVSWGFFLLNYRTFKRICFKENAYDGFLIRWVHAFRGRQKLPVMGSPLFKRYKWTKVFFMPFYTLLKVGAWWGMAALFVWLAGICWALIGGLMIHFAKIRIPPGLWGPGGLWDMWGLW
jgi:hypothetical protein